jgi:hypothetical protein
MVKIVLIGGKKRLRSHPIKAMAYEAKGITAETRAKGT